MHERETVSKVNDTRFVDSIFKNDAYPTNLDNRRFGCTSSQIAKQTNTLHNYTRHI
jgi:uncharacterized protein YozE (UPF0346 family)